MVGQRTFLCRTHKQIFNNATLPVNCFRFVGNGMVHVVGQPVLFLFPGRESKILLILWLMLYVIWLMLYVMPLVLCA